MNKDIRYLKRFLDYDKWRIDELCDKLDPQLTIIGQRLQSNTNKIVILYVTNDELYELVELLDGNNFEVVYHDPPNAPIGVADLIPIYHVIMDEDEDEDEEEVEVKIETFTTADATFEREHECSFSAPTKVTIRGFRSRIPVIDDLPLFDKEFKPP